jgi:HK97 family phage portal protein
MSYWENFKRLLRNDIPQTPATEITTNSSTWGDFFSPMIGLPAVTEKTAMTISAVYACVNLIAGAISALPMNIYRRQPDGERDQVHNDGLWWTLNEQFSPRWSAACGWEFLVQSLLFHGDAFAIIQRNRAGEVVGLDPRHPSWVSVLPSNDGSRLVYAIANDQRIPDSGFRVFDQDDVIHVAGFGFDGFRSVSPLRHHLSMSGAVSLAAQEYSARFFANSARPDIVLTSDQPINAETADRIREGWERLYKGVENSHKPAVLGMGFKAQPLTMTAEDAQLLATRQFQIEEIARAYGVPPFMIGHTEKTTSWGSGVETMGTGFVRFTLRQHLNKFQNEINRKFFRTAVRFAEFDTFELERADMKSLFESFRVAIGRAGEPGFMSTDEVRLKLNMKRTDGGDKLASGDAATPPASGGQNAPEQAA